eukprot:997408-Rhodomonas_salina.1
MKSVIPRIRSTYVSENCIPGKANAKKGEAGTLPHAMKIMSRIRERCSFAHIGLVDRGYCPEEPRPSQGKASEDDQVVGVVVFAQKHQDDPNEGAQERDDEDPALVHCRVPQWLDVHAHPARCHTNATDLIRRVDSQRLPLLCRGHAHGFLRGAKSCWREESRD